MKWISTKERLPEHGQEILLVTYDEEYRCKDDVKDWCRDEDGNPEHFPEKLAFTTAFFTITEMWKELAGNTFFSWEDEYGGAAQSKIDMIEESGQPCHITHWMPLPEPPSRDEIERVAKQ